MAFDPDDDRPLWERAGDRDLASVLGTWMTHPFTIGHVDGRRIGRRSNRKRHATTSQRNAMQLDRRRGGRR